MALQTVLDLPLTREATFQGSPAADPPSYATQLLPGKDNNSRNSVQFVGNATCILEIKGVRVMTDPNFLHQGDHVHLGPGVTARRMHDPAFNLEECPPVDFILLSHLHEDYFDLVVAEKLRRSIPIISTPHATSGLANQGYTHLITLDTWKSALITHDGIKKFTITSMPGKHTIGVFNEMVEVMDAIPPVMGSLIELLDEDNKVEFTIYISGDTLFCEKLKDIHTKHPHIDLCLLHLGGTTIPVINVMVTMDAVQGINLLHVVNPDTTIPVHFDDYDAFLSPLEDFKKLVEKEGWSDRVIYLDRGETYRF
ncbi:Metallo-hydrolase/oxidoreductase [Dacryopinax primogenitus]|uniref:Metallo-hydrolase/oxidoreductase n=1 Tax=Dacryopinax primogenitus (strain DJM 731) TaxID=1858805 RepID=M5G1Y9_DACPD|nr:Metallo-hydrolase/oxidoreductase [Dacryopinax primogenitus]EJU04196.1 Metallo-hydrolase/oxidoreductase [Dacryopinax primogenitus]